METMVVGLLVIGAVVAVSTMQVPVTQHRLLPADSGLVKSWLTAYSSHPSEDPDHEHSSLLEESIFDAYAGDDTLVKANLDAFFEGLGQRLWVQHEDSRPIPIHGPKYPPRVGSTTETLTYNARYGTTIITPGMSTYAPGQAIDLDLLSLWANDVARGNGIPYTAIVTLEDQNGDHIKRTTNGWIRVAGHYLDTPDEPREVTITLGYIDGVGDDLLKHDATGLAPDGDAWRWDVRLRLSGTQPGAAWLTQDDVVRFYPPSGWEFNDLWNGQTWDLVEDDPEAPTPMLRFEWRGPGQAGVGTQELRFNLTRPQAVPLVHYEVLHAVVEGDRASTANLFLAPAVPTADAPLGLHVAYTDPLDTERRAFSVQIINPRDDQWSVANVTLRFEGKPHQFRDYRDGPGPAPAPASTSWKWGEQGLDSYFWWQADAGTSGNELGPNEAKAWRLDLGIRTYDDSSAQKHLRPVLEALEGDEVMAQYSAYPSGGVGHYEALLPPQLQPGEHSLQVPRGRVEGVPVGRGSYAVAVDALGVLDDVQRARQSMALDVSPGLHKPGDELTVTLDAGDLLRTVRNLGAIDDDALSLHLEATDLFGHMTGEALAVLDQELDAQLASPVVGWAWMDANGVGALDLVVAYQDGHLLTLDGDTLLDDEQVTLYRSELGEAITTGPVVADFDGVAGEEFVVGTHDVGYGKSYLRVLDEKHERVEQVDLNGAASRMVESTCDGPGVLFFMSPYRNGQLDYGVSGAAQSDWTALSRWSWEGQVSGKTEQSQEGLVIREGAFGPFGACGVAYGLSGGDVVRVDGEDPELEVWRFESGDTIRGLWVEDTVTSPVERARAGEPVPVRSDEVVVVTDEHGLEVFAGWLPPARSAVEEFDLLPGDTLLGLGWVDAVTGYVVSESGAVWRTQNGGDSWDSLDAVPFDVGERVVDFAFGGDGDGVFINQKRETVTLRSNGYSAQKPQPDLAEAGFFGFTETPTTPGYLMIRPGEEQVKVREWDMALNIPSQTPTGKFVSCACTQAAGTMHALGGILGDDVYLDTSAPRVIPNVAAVKASAASPLDMALLATSDALVVNQTTHTTAHTVAGQDAAALASGVTAARHPAAADLLAGGHAYTATEAGLVHAYHGDATLNVSSGPAGRWQVGRDSIQNTSPSSSYWYRVVPETPPAEAESVVGTLSVIDVGDAPPGQVTWRLHAPSGATHEGRSQDPISFVWETGMFLEVRFDSGRGLDQELALVIDTATDKIILAAVADPDCLDCLAPIADRGDSGYGSGIWSDPAGFLPRVVLPAIGPDPVLLKRPGGGIVIAAGNNTDGYYLYDAASGLATAGLSLDLDAADPVHLGVARMSDGSDALWLEEGVEAGLDSLPLGGIVPSQGGLRALGSKLWRLDPATGTVLCAWDLEDTDTVGHRLTGAVAGSSTHLVSGTMLGRVGVLGLEGCQVEWEDTPVETGTLLRFTVPPSARQFLGPVIVNATLRLDVEGLGEVELYLLDYSIKSTQDRPELFVQYMVALSIWSEHDLWV